MKNNSSFWYKEGGVGVIVKQNFHFLLCVHYYCLEFRPYRSDREVLAGQASFCSSKANEDPSAKLGVGSVLKPMGP